MKQKAQVWQLELGVSLVIVITAFIIFFTFTQPLKTQQFQTNDIYIVPQLLLAPSFPQNWDVGSVQQIGLMDSPSRLNSTKVSYLYQMSNEQIKQSLGIQSEFKIQLLQNNIPLIIEGRSYIGTQPVNAQKVSAVTRFIIYEQTPTVLEVILWE